MVDVLFDFNENNKNNICDILLLDHSYLKSCIENLKNDLVDKKKKLVLGRRFLDAFEKHTAAEEKAVYKPLLDIEFFRTEVIEGSVEHNIAQKSARRLTTELLRARKLSDEAEVELRVLAELIERHLEKEERGLILQMRFYLTDEVLDEIGMQFMRLRGFTSEDLQDYPVLNKEMATVRLMKNRMPANYNTRVQQGYSYK